MFILTWLNIDALHTTQQTTSKQWRDWLTELRFYVPLDRKMVTLETIPKPISWLDMKKLNLTQHKHACTNQKKCTTTQNKHRKLKPGLVAAYDIRPGNGDGIFWFQCFINLSLTYSLRHLPTYLQPRTQCKEVQWFNCRPLPLKPDICFSIYGATHRVRLNFFSKNRINRVLELEHTNNDCRML